MRGREGKVGKGGKERGEREEKGMESYGMGRCMILYIWRECIARGVALMGVIKLHCIDGVNISALV